MIVGSVAGADRGAWEEAPPVSSSKGCRISCSSKAELVAGIVCLGMATQSELLSISGNSEGERPSLDPRELK